MTNGIGHNGGPTLEGGHSWRKYSWTKARKALMPTLPVEVVRLRVKRAAELGLPYKTYAGVRAATGHDLIGFLFSSNALRLLRNETLAPREQDKLIALNADRTALVHRPLDPVSVMANDGIDSAVVAPSLIQSWGQTRTELLSLVRQKKASADRFLVVGQGDLEREWLTAGGFAGFLSGDVFFDRQTA